MSSTEHEKLEATLASLEKYLLMQLPRVGDWCFQPSRTPEDILKDLKDKLFSLENSYWKLVENEKSNCLTIEVFRNDKAQLTLGINNNQELEVSHTYTSHLNSPRVRLAEFHLDHKKFLKFIKKQLKTAYLYNQRC